MVQPPSLQRLLKSLITLENSFDESGKPSDPYRVEAAIVFGVAEADVTDAMRGVVKRALHSAACSSGMYAPTYAHCDFRDIQRSMAKDRQAKAGQRKSRRDRLQDLQARGYAR